ncbi:MAG: leucine-rich repeat protein, partial [Clostridia bacterium]|nr:leucine-rich repeat protein [Clostridia bacterium]
MIRKRLFSLLTALALLATLAWGSAFSAMGKTVTELSSEMYNNFVSAPAEIFLYQTEYLKEMYRYTDAQVATLQTTSNNITAGCNTAEKKINAVATWLAKNVGYNKDYTSGNSARPASDPITVLNHRDAVCEGYARTAEALLQLAGVPCVYVLAPNHAWNMAYTGSRWILFDSTWMSRSVFKNGQLTLSNKIDTAWYDFTIAKANGEANHPILELPLMIHSGALLEFPKYTAAKSYTVPSTVTELSNGAFAECKGLQQISLPSTLSTISSRAFYRCESLKTLVIPSGVSYLAADAIYYCDSLETLGFNGQYTTLDLRQMVTNSALKTVSIFPNVKVIGEAAFRNCYNLEWVILLGDIRRVESYAFAGCTSLSAIENFAKIQNFGIGAFQGCTAFEKLTFTENVQAIGTAAFENCENLAEITLKEGVTRIGEKAFAGCPLTKVTVPNSVTELSANAFAGCPLTELTVGGGVTTVEKDLAYRQETLTKVTLQEGITTIGESAFTSCPALTEVTLPATLQTIDRFAFLDCAALTGLILPEGLTSIGYSAFYSCPALKYVYVPASVTEIGYDAFKRLAPGFTLYGKAGSVAQEYAKQNGIPFRVGMP